jgi:phasin family protein
MKSPNEVKKIMSDAAQETIQASTAQVANVQKAFEGSTVQTRAAVEKGLDHASKTAADLMKAAEDAAEFGRGNLEAVTKASQLYMTGMQDLSRQTMALFQALSDHTLEGMKTLSSVKSLKDAAEFQASFTKTTFERAMNDTVKLQEAAIKVAEQSFAPLTARMTVAMEKVATPLAA